MGLINSSVDVFKYTSNFQSIDKENQALALRVFGLNEICVFHRKPLH